jgi:hypothetical protein
MGMVAGGVRDIYVPAAFRLHIHDDTAKRKKEKEKKKRVERKEEDPANSRTQQTDGIS